MDTALDKLMDVVDGGWLECSDFAKDARALFALALSKLEPGERERYFAEIERGDLRAAVKQFERPSPYPRAIEAQS